MATTDGEHDGASAPRGSETRSFLAAVADTLMPGVRLEDDGTLRTAPAAVARAAAARDPARDFLAWNREERERLVADLLADADAPAARALSRVLHGAARAFYADLPRDHLRNARVWTGVERQADPPALGNPRLVGDEVVAPTEALWNGTAFAVGGGTRVYGAQA